MGYCGDDVGVGTCTGEQLHNPEVWWLEKCKNIISLSKHLCCVRCSLVPDLRCQVGLPNFWHQTDSTEQTNELYGVPCCRHGGLHCAGRGLCHKQSSGCWEHVVLRTFDDERWNANFQMRCGTFVRLCGRLAPCPVCWDTPFRCPVSVKRHKRFGSDLQKLDIMWFFAILTSWNQPECNLFISKFRFGLAV